MIIPCKAIPAEWHSSVLKKLCILWSCDKSDLEDQLIRIPHRRMNRRAVRLTDKLQIILSAALLLHS